MKTFQRFEIDMSNKVIEVPPVQQEKVVTPTTELQEITPDEKYNGLSKVTVEAVTNEIDENIKKENIKTGVTILGVEGSVIEKNTTTLEVKKDGEYTPEEPYNGFESVTVDVNKEAKEIEPKVTEQVILPSEDTLINKVTVKAVTGDIDENITPENVKSGVTILGVEGAVIELAGEELEIDPKAEAQDFTPKSPKNGYTKVTVNAAALEEVSVTLSKEEDQEITPTEENIGISKVTVPKVTSEIDENITAENIKSGVEILGVTGTYDNYPETEEVSVTPTTESQEITPTEGKLIEKVNVDAVTSDIDENIIPDNIRKDTTILGVTGTLNPAEGELVNYMIAADFTYTLYSAPWRRYSDKDYTEEEVKKTQEFIDKLEGKII